MSSIGYKYFIDAANEIYTTQGIISEVDFSSVLSTKAQFFKDNINTYQEHTFADINTNRVFSELRKISELYFSSNVDQLNDSIYVDNNFSNYFNSIALKLYETECDAHRNIARMDKRVKNGSLVISLNKDEDDSLSFIILKLDYESIIDKNYERNSGFFIDDKKVEQKLCFVIVRKTDEMVEFEKILISEKHISEYWPEKFLYLTPLTSSQKSTKDALTQINYTLKSVKTKFPDDIVQIKSIILGYFSSNDRFTFSDFWDSVFIDYFNTKYSRDMTDELKTIKDSFETKLTNDKILREFNIDHSIVKQKLVNKTFKANKYFEIKRISKNVDDDEITIDPEYASIIHSSSQDDYYFRLKVDASYVDKYKDEFDIIEVD